MPEYKYPEKLPGQLYDANTQCKWQFGEKAKLCTLDLKKASVTVRPCLVRASPNAVSRDVAGIDAFCISWGQTSGPVG